MSLKNTSLTGNLTTAIILAHLVSLGKTMLIPFGDAVAYDLAMEEPDGTVRRIQCKTGWSKQGTIHFNVHSQQKSTGKRSYVGRADLFGVYSPDTKRIYLVPVEDCAAVDGVLRTEAPRNNQQKKIRWAADYEISSPNQSASPEQG